MVFACPVPPTKEGERTTTFVAIQLQVHVLVYAVLPGVPSPRSE